MVDGLPPFTPTPSVEVMHKVVDEVAAEVSAAVATAGNSAVVGDEEADESSAAVASTSFNEAVYTRDESACLSDWPGPCCFGSRHGRQ